VAARQAAAEAEILRIALQSETTDDEVQLRVNEQDMQSLRALMPSGGIGTSGTF
jgi:hypothetical protein